MIRAYSTITGTPGALSCFIVLRLPLILHAYSPRVLRGFLEDSKKQSTHFGSVPSDIYLSNNIMYAGIGPVVKQNVTSQNTFIPADPVRRHVGMDVLNATCAVGQYSGSSHRGVDWVFDTPFHFIRIEVSSLQLYTIRRSVAIVRNSNKLTVCSARSPLHIDCRHSCSQRKTARRAAKRENVRGGLFWPVVQVRDP